jgi:hypothetical protein
MNVPFILLLKMTFINLSLLHILIRKIGQVVYKHFPPVLLKMNYFFVLVLSYRNLKMLNK